MTAFYIVLLIINLVCVGVNCVTLGLAIQDRQIGLAACVVGALVWAASWAVVCGFALASMP